MKEMIICGIIILIRFAAHSQLPNKIAYGRPKNESNRKASEF